MRAAVIILAFAMATMLLGCGQPTPGPQGPKGEPGAQGIPGPGRTSRACRFNGAARRLSTVLRGGQEMRARL